MRLQALGAYIDQAAAKRRLARKKARLEEARTMLGMSIMVGSLMFGMGVGIGISWIPRPEKLDISGYRGLMLVLSAATIGCSLMCIPSILEVRELSLLRREKDQQRDRREDQHG